MKVQRYWFGLLFRSWEDRALGINNSIRGARVIFKPTSYFTLKSIYGRQRTGFDISNGLSRQETLKGMTIWAAYANFEDTEKGSIEINKFADFVVLDQDIMEVQIDEVPNIKINGTYINGEKVF